MVSKQKYRYWYDLTHEEQLHFAHTVIKDKVDGQEELKQAALKFGLVLLDEPTLIDLQWMANHL